MKALRRLFGLDFPDPVPGQVWRSAHSGRAVRVDSVCRSDCGRLWHIDLQHEDGTGFNPLPLTYYVTPAQWRRMLRDEARRLMGGGTIEPSAPWPRGVNVNPRPTYPRPPAPPAPPRDLSGAGAASDMRDMVRRLVDALDGNGPKQPVRNEANDWLVRQASSGEGPVPLDQLPPWLPALEKAALCLRMAHEQLAADIVCRSAAEELEAVAATTRGVRVEDGGQSNG